MRARTVEHHYSHKVEKPQYKYILFRCPLHQVSISNFFINFAFRQAMFLGRRVSWTTASVATKKYATINKHHKSC